MPLPWEQRLYFSAFLAVNHDHVTTFCPMQCKNIYYVRWIEFPERKSLYPSSLLSPMHRLECRVDDWNFGSQVGSGGRRHTTKIMEQQDKRNPGYLVSWSAKPVLSYLNLDSHYASEYKHISSLSHYYFSFFLSHASASKLSPKWHTYTLKVEDIYGGETSAI